MMVVARIATLLIPLTMFIVITRINVSYPLKCCVANTELKTNDSDGEIFPCTNQGTSCRDVGCGNSKCLPQKDTPETEPETVCNTSVTCTGSKPLCRILYFEHLIAEPPEADLNHMSNGEHHHSSATQDADPPAKFRSTVYRVVQECYENMGNEVSSGCDFAHKIFYVQDEPDERITLEKECFCEQDNCNKDIAYTCTLVDRDTPTMADTCQSEGVRVSGVLLVLIMTLVCNLCVIL